MSDSPLPLVPLEKVCVFMQAALAITGKKNHLK